MGETTKTADQAASTVASNETELNPEAGISGAAAFATAESAEILNLLGDDAEAGGQCCGGACCSV